MNFDELKLIVSRGESDTLEFKKSTAKLHAIFETVCGFLNGRGGTALIGVTDNQKIVGQQIADSTKLEIANKISLIEPSAQPDIEFVPLPNGLQVIVISVRPGKYVPYTFDGRSFCRTQSQTHRMTRYRYDQLIYDGKRPDTSWEMQLNDSTIEDLDQDAIKKTLTIAVNANRLSAEVLNESIEEKLKKLELVREGRLTNAAMVLFAKSVAPNFSQCLIKLARFRGKDKLGEFIDNEMVSGNAFRIMNAANDFIIKHLPVASFFDENKFERVDKPPLPVLAVREALSNALCHRDYSVHNAAITLAIFDDRLEVWNNGELLEPLTIDDLRKVHQSYPRNKRMARVFYLRKYVETWGTGTTKMIELCRESHVPEPVFSEYSAGFAVTFKFKESIGLYNIAKAQELQMLTARQSAIISLLQDNGPMSSRSILESLENPLSERMMRRELAQLKKLNLISLEGHGRSALWVLQ